MAIQKDLIKDTWSPDIQQLHPDWARPYSLSRVQLFWWTLIIVVCCIVAFIKTGRIAFNTTALILFGVSLTTNTGGNLIDKDQIKKIPDQRHQDLPSQGFWTDIISDENGMSLHRFQTVVINILFGMVFLSAFFRDIQFPEFGDWQLALLGVSSGGYLAVKLNENEPPVSGAAAPTPATSTPANPMGNMNMATTPTPPDTGGQMDAGMNMGTPNTNSAATDSQGSTATPDHGGSMPMDKQNTSNSQSESVVNPATDTMTMPTGSNSDQKDELIDAFRYKEHLVTMYKTDDPAFLVGKLYIAKKLVMYDYSPYDQSLCSHLAYNLFYSLREMAVFLIDSDPSLKLLSSRHGSGNMANHNL